VEEATAFVPYQRALGGVDAVAELEKSHLSLGLPDEQVEVVIVKPAPASGRVIGNTEDLFHPCSFPV
jgi:hypothetical protein